MRVFDKDMTLHSSKYNLNDKVSYRDTLYYITDITYYSGLAQFSYWIVCYEHHIPLKHDVPEDELESNNPYFTPMYE